MEHQASGTCHAMSYSSNQAGATPDSSSSHPHSWGASTAAEALGLIGTGSWPIRTRLQPFGPLLPIGGCCFLLSLQVVETEQPPTGLILFRYSSLCKETVVDDSSLSDSAVHMSVCHRPGALGPVLLSRLRRFSVPNESP